MLFISCRDKQNREQAIQGDQADIKESDISSVYM